MTNKRGLVSIHPEGERGKADVEPCGIVGSLDTFAGKVQVRWVPEAAVSSLGLLPYFIEFLKVSGRFDSWVADCPLEYQSGNAPQKRDVRSLYCEEFFDPSHRKSPLRQPPTEGYGVRSESKRPECVAWHPKSPRAKPRVFSGNGLQVIDICCLECKRSQVQNASDVRSAG